MIINKTVDIKINATKYHHYKLYDKKSKNIYSSFICAWLIAWSYNPCWFR